MEKPRKRRIACDACYRRKIRCELSDDGKKCDWCEHHSLLCTFSRSKARTVTTAKTAKQGFAQRLAHIETCLSNSVLADNSQQTSKASSISPSQSAEQSASPAITQTTSHPRAACRCESALGTTIPRSTNSALGQIYFAGQRFGNICPQNGIPHFTTQCEQWIRSKTGQEPRFRNIFTDNKDDNGNEEFPAGSSVPLRQGSETSKTNLPEKWVLDGILQEFISSDFSLVFPLVDYVLFQQTAELAYSTHHKDLGVEVVSAKACALSFVATVVAHFPTHALTQYVDADACAREAQLMMADFLEDTSITTLQTVFMMTLYESFCGHLQVASMYHAVACRIISALGGHTLNFTVPKDRELTNQDREDCQVRMIFWLCYSFDKDIALRTGHPPIIADEFCDLTLPEGYHEIQFGDRHRRVDTNFQLPSLVSDLRLAILKSKALRALYTPPSLHRSDSELLRTIRELDEELECWRASIPAKFSPALSLRKGVRLTPDLTQLKNMLHVSLHLEYHFLVNIIHGASGRCVTDSLLQGSESVLGVQSSLDLAVEASRSTIIYLGSASDRLASEAFWVFIFYPVSAWMTLFFNILRNPRHEYAWHDMKLLSGASAIMWNLPIRRVTPFELVYLKKMSALIDELSRLAECAIKKACNNQDVMY